VNEPPPDEPCTDTYGMTLLIPVADTWADWEDYRCESIEAAENELFGFIRGHADAKAGATPGT